MSTIERGPTGHAWRYVPTEKILTVYGTEVVNKHHCSSCKGKSKNESEFYHYNQDKPFDTCLKCNDERRKLNAKIKRRKDKGIHVDKNLNTIPNLEEMDLS